ncbi:L-ribulose-5-phosphate 4-epimerase AraD [Streptomyces sp. NPDC050121]|uniref:L-ribulose-5-phosphate 4-epimerase AraD n=1 Tax=Streptomyces sp. NPDC050121 TaxID=3365601 RepID=UPI0037AA7B97
MTVRVRDGLRQEVLDANLAIPQVGLATLTWGNVSGIDREAGLFVIKPSGVPYEDLTIEHLVTVRLFDGEVVDGDLRPSTDTETHRCLYLAFPSIGGVTHTHSTHAVAFAQARRDIPVLGTTHADTFNGPISCTPDLTPAQCATDYEYNTGRVIVDMLRNDRKAVEVPAALVAGHGPFTWGASARKSLEHAIICEAVADIALHTLALAPTSPPPPHLLARHYTRKHGPDAYYGNPEPGVTAGL